MHTIGLIAAMASESNALLRQIKKPARIRLGSLPVAVFKVGSHECALITSGMGILRAEAATRLLIEKFHPSCLISFGIAGAVRADLHIGDVVMAGRNALLEKDRVGSWQALAEFSESTCSALSRRLESQHVRFLRGTALTTRGSQLASAPPEWLNPILEMETAGILKVTQASQLPLIVLRSISDGPSAPIPLDLGKVMDANGRLLVGTLLQELVRHPGLLLRSGPLLQNSQTAANHAALAALTALEQPDPL